MAGLTPQGLSIKRQQEVIDSRITDARNFFGSTVSTNVDSVIGRMLRIGSADEADLWEVALSVYNSFNPDLAVGVSLDRLVSFSNIRRQGDAPSVAELFVTGDYEAVIPKGSIVRSRETGRDFETSREVVLNESGVSGFVFEVIVEQDNTEYIVSLDANDHVFVSGEDETEESIAQGIRDMLRSELAGYTVRVINGNQVQVSFDDVFITRNVILSSNLYYSKISKIVESQAQIFGPVEQPRGTLEVIASPVSGWDSVTNLDPASPGRFRETNFELRSRFKNSKEARSLGTVDAIYSKLTTIEGVQSVQVHENTSENVDNNGVPPHAVHAIVLGGTTRKVGEMLWTAKPAGITLHGSTTVQVDDSQGLSHPVSFSRPTPVPINITISVSAMENAKLTSDVSEQIVTNLLEYFNNTYLVGDDIIYSRMYQPLNKVDNLQVDELLISRESEEPKAGNVVISYDEVATLRRNNIKIIEG